MLKITVSHAEEKPELEIFAVGNLVISDCGTIVIVTDSHQDASYFGGTVIYDSIGAQSGSFYKDAFKLFKGKIIMEQ